MLEIFSTEAVSKGHPDKLCDGIADAILDAILKEDKYAHTAIEVMAGKNQLFIVGEVKSSANVDYEAIAREKIKEIGYDDDEFGFRYDQVDILVSIAQQSADIDLGVSLQDDIGAGDQGIMFGYADNESENYLPLAFNLACKMMYRLDEYKNENDLLGPDGKGQISLAYIDGKPSYISTIVLSNQHRDCLSIDEVRSLLRKEVIDKALPQELINEKTEIMINPTGRFVIGGPVGDTGLTGRKLMNDSYGGFAPHGGGAFSGKDPSKVDRSGAYYARYAAKNMVAAGLADKMVIECAYAIGHPYPVSLFIDTKGTAHVKEEVLYRALKENFSFRVKDMLNELNLFAPIYSGLSNYSHFGKEGYSFEKLDKVEQLKKYLEESYD